MAISTPLSDENDVYSQPSALTVTPLNNQTAWQHSVAYPFDEYQLTGTRQQSSATAAVDVFGMAGDDRLESAYGGSHLYGEDGNDVLSAIAGVLSQQTSASLTYFTVTIEEEIEFVDQDLNGIEETIIHEHKIYEPLGSQSYQQLIETPFWSGQDQLFGGDGNDQLFGGGSGDALYGGADHDHLYGAGNYIQTLNRREETINRTYEVTQAAVVEQYDVLIEDIGDLLYGADGNDVIDGGAGADVIRAGSGDDQVYGGATQRIELNSTRIVEDQYADQVGGAYIAVNRLTTDTLQYVVVESGDDWIQLAEGNDQADGDTGNDTIYGGTGNDRLTGGSSVMIDIGQQITTLELHEHQYDQISESHTMVSKEFDVQAVRGGDDLLYGGEGNDELSGGDGADQLYGGMGNDVMTGGESTLIYQHNQHYLEERSTGNLSVRVMDQIEQEHFVIEDGIDLMYGGSGHDQLEGGTADDQLHGGSGDDVLKGGMGFAAHLSLTTTSAILTYQQDVPQNSQDYQSSYQTKTQYVSGGQDTLMGNSGDDQIDGEEGNDVLYGGSGNDHLLGGTAYLARFINQHSEEQRYQRQAGQPLTMVIMNDSTEEMKIIGGGDDQIMAGSGDDVADGQDGQDILYGQQGNDILYGGATTTQYTFIQTSSSTREEQSSGVNTNQIYNIYEEFYEIRDVVVLSGEDQLYGGQGQDQLYGMQGNDLLYGGLNHDHLYGGQGQTFSLSYQHRIDSSGHSPIIEEGTEYTWVSGGQDRMFGGLGNDYLDGGDDQDQLYGGDDHDQLYGGDDQDQLYGEAGDDLLDGGAGDDQLKGGDGDDTIHAGDGQDQVTGGQGQDELLGDDGADQISGGAGDDQLYGGAGDDVIQGGSGADRLVGGSGHDQLIGGSGADRYEFNRGDQGTTIIEKGNDQDQLVFDSSIALADVWWSRQGQDLQIDLLGQPDNRVTIKDWYVQPEKQIEQVQFGDGQMLNQTQIQALVDAMAGLTPPALVSNTFTVSVQSDVLMWG